MSRFKIYGMIALMLSALTGCQKQSKQPDAYGSFEATTMSISPEIGGKITDLAIQEGQTYDKGQTIGWTDTTQLHLQKQQLLAQKANVRTRLDQVQAQLAVHEARIDKLKKELERFRGLVETGGATRKQVDDLENELEVAKRQKRATASKISEIHSKMRSVDRQIAQVDDKIDKCRITFPVKGTVLQQLKEEGEFTRPGSPICRVAQLDHLEFKGFITGTQLAKVQLGQKVTVRIDKTDDTYQTFPGKITWIAEEAEFSPKNIKTKEERANLVYAMKVRVKNDGKLKIGMPGEILFE